MIAQSPDIWRLTHVEGCLGHLVAQTRLCHGYWLIIAHCELQTTVRMNTHMMLIDDHILVDN